MNIGIRFNPRGDMESELHHLPLWFVFNIRNTSEIDVDSLCYHVVGIIIKAKAVDLFN